MMQKQLEDATVYRAFSVENGGFRTFEKTSVGTVKGIKCASHAAYRVIGGQGVTVQTMTFVADADADIRTGDTLRIGEQDWMVEAVMVTPFNRFLLAEAVWVP